jgi:dienelactone hydrolase
MVICPGGGYSGLSVDEGEGYAKWLTENGVTAFVLKYRLSKNGYHHPAMLQDATRALRTVRANAEKWHLDPQKIGIMGSSAGGHLASTLLTHFDAGNPEASDPIDRVSSRPDLGILCYAVITMGPNTEPGTKNNLLGKDPSPDLIDFLSNEKHVTKETPPVFIWHTWEDRGVRVENSLNFAKALREKCVPFDLHIYQNGGHGIGLGGGGQKPEILHPWTQDCLYWLRAQGFIK